MLRPSNPLSHPLRCVSAVSGPQPLLHFLFTPSLCDSSTRHLVQTTSKMADLSSPTGRRAVSMPLSATRPKFARQLDFEPLTTATDDSEELYNHINTRIYAIDVSKKRSPYWPTQSGEKLVATGVLVVQRKKPFGLVILSVGTQVSHTLFRRSKAWEVMTGMFCLRIDNTKYWRIEIRE